jgi:hypothetical protein
MKLVEYEIIDHGMEHSQYFQGYGVYGTRFTHVWTGVGDSSKEAYNDALDQMFMDDREAAEKMPTRPSGIRARPKVPHDSEDVYFYVSIRARLKEGKK